MDAGCAVSEPEVRRFLLRTSTARVSTALQYCSTAAGPYAFRPGRGVGPRAQLDVRRFGAVRRGGRLDVQLGQPARSADAKRGTLRRHVLEVEEVVVGRPRRHRAYKGILDLVAVDEAVEPR